MKINFKLVKPYYVNSINNYRNNVSFGEVDEGYRDIQPDWHNNCYVLNENPVDDSFQYTELENNETKFRNLPQSPIHNKIREQAFISSLFGYDESQDEDFLERLTY